MTYESGDLIHTNEGDFLLISIEVCGGKNEYFGWGAIYIDDEDGSPTEMQYINEDLDDLIYELNEACKINSSTSKEDIIRSRSLF